MEWLKGLYNIFWGISKIREKTLQFSIECSDENKYFSSKFLFTENGITVWKWIYMISVYSLLLTYLFFVSITAVI